MCSSDLTAGSYDFHTGSLTLTASADHGDGAGAKAFYATAESAAVCSVNETTGAVTFLSDGPCVAYATIAAVTGFIAGIYLDLSPSTSGPFGQWTLVMVLSCFAISYLGYGDDAVNSNPAGLILMTSSAVVATLIGYLLIGLIFGLNLGSTFHTLKTILGFGIWSALIAPITVPFIARAHSVVYSGIK